MPDFCRPQRGFHHTVDSALVVLCDLGLSASRITVRMAGAGWPSLWVVDQTPPAGVPLDPDVSVSLFVAGPGLFQSLPVGFWDEGGQAEMGTKEIVSVIDDPVQKLSHWVREGARLFDIQPGNHAACERWIKLFALNPDHWPRERWYGLALLLPTLHRLAGREEGVRFALKLVFDLRLAEIRQHSGFRYLANEDVTLLGAKASRLGADFVIGDRVEDQAHLLLVIGPVPLPTYYQYQQKAEQQQLRDVLSLCVPMYHRYRVGWEVLDRRQAPRLGCEERNARLGVNSYLGNEV